MFTEKVIIIGANGQVGSALVDLLQEQAIPLSRNDLDLSNPLSIRNTLSKYEASVIINAAAYTAVDKAEEEKDLANIINGESVNEISKYCNENNIIFVHYSTDYVFNGEGIAPWEPNDNPCPVNAYGESKLKGEEYIKNNGGKYLIFRTSWVYDYSRKNFFNTMLRLGQEREELSIVDDQIGAPSYAPDIALSTIEALNNSLNKDNFPSGIYHLCGRGEASWFDFAQAIFDQASISNINTKIKKLTPVPSSSYPTPAKRPMNSRMDTSLTRNILKTSMPDWHESLEKCFKNKR